MQDASSKPRSVVGCTEQGDGAWSEKSGQVRVIVGGDGHRSGFHELRLVHPPLISSFAMIMRRISLAPSPMR